MKRKGMILISVVGFSILVIISSLVMATVAYNRYRYIMRYSNFIQGYSLANAGLGRLKYKISKSDFTNENFAFPASSSNAIAITINQPNNTAVISVADDTGGVTLDVSYRGELLTSYSIRKN